MSHHHSDVLKAKEVVRILEHLGFEHVRTHGSHQHFRDANGRHTVVPVHPAVICCLAWRGASPRRSA